MMVAVDLGPARFIFHFGTVSLAILAFQSL
jgi:hypothetical protein